MMNCGECFLMLDDYLEAEPEATEMLQIKNHLSACAGCEQHLAELQKEKELYRVYSSQIKAAPALWNNIQSELEEFDRRRFASSISLHGRFIERLSFLFFNPSFTASALLFLIAAVGIVGLIKYQFSKEVLETKTISLNQEQNHMPPSAPLPPPAMNVETDSATSNIGEISSPVRRQLTGTFAIIRATKKINKQLQPPIKPQLPETSALLPVTADRRLTSDAIAKKAEQEYLKAIDLLNRDIKNQQKQRLPEKNPMLEVALANADRAIEATRRAVSEQPGDPVAIQYMAAAYSKKIELLRTMADR